MKHSARFASCLKTLVAILAVAGLMQAWPGAASADGLNQWASGFAAQGLDGTVRALAVDGSGNLYAGGDFSMAGEVAVNCVARRDAATGAWSALGSGMDGPVYALAVDAGGGVYAGGYFDTAGGVTVNHVARWDGGTWSALGDGIGGSHIGVQALALDGAGNLYAGGSFATAGGVAAINIAKWDGTGWSAVGYPGSSVYALAVDDSGNLYAGGSFSGGVKIWNGSTWNVAGAGIGSYGLVYALAAHGADLFAGGYFTTAGGLAASSVARWDGSAWSALGSGVDGGAVFALAVDGGGDLYAGGAFAAAGGVTASRVARWDGSAWSALGGGVDDVVNALALHAGGGLYAGGRFQVAEGSVANYVALWAGGGWSGLGSGGEGRGMGSRVAALAEDDTGALYAGGSFATAGNVVARRVARWDGSTWSDLGGGVDGPVSPGVFALALDGSGNLYAGGRFATAGGVEASNVARWDGAQWHSLGSGVDGYVNALAVDAGGSLYAGGVFSNAGGVAASKIARWDPASETWSGVGGGVGGSYPYVSALVFDGGGALYAGGEFSTAGGEAAANVARWDGSAWSALGDGTGGADPYVYALAVDGASLYAGGSFSTAGGTAVSNIARWDGSAWSDLGSGLGAAEVDYVEALAAGGCGDLYAGGWFATAGGVAASHIARWDGSAWSALGNGVDSDVYALSADGRGHLYAGGGFGTAGGLPSSYIGRWDTEPCSIVVTSDADSGPGTLRQAIADVADGGTITFAGDMTIHLGSTLTLARNVTIDGAGHDIVVSGDTDGDGSGDVRVLYVNSGVIASLKRLTVTKGFAGGTCPADDGGGVYSLGTLSATGCTFSANHATHIGGGIYSTAGGLTVTDSTFTDNSAAFGAGLVLDGGTATLTHSTFSGNIADAGGGAIRNDPYYPPGIVVVTNCTFSGNSAGWAGGGAIANNLGTVTVTNSTFSGNSAGWMDGGAIKSSATTTVRNSLFVKGASGANCYGTIDGADNLLDEGTCGPGSINSSTILLGAPGSYGGATQTVPLLPGSAAIDAGDPATCPATDQRGLPRVGTCDIGAFESQGFALGSLTGDGQSTLVNTAFAEPLGLTVTANDPAEPVDGGLVTFTPPAEGASAAIEGSPATITGGAVSATAAANGTRGSYSVTASAGGAADAAFALANEGPAAITVTSAADSGEGTLRQAIADVADGGTISFAGDMTIRLASTLVLDRDVTIDGTGHSVTLSGDTDDDNSGEVQVLLVNSGVTAFLQHLTVTKGATGYGAGLRNAGNLTVTDCTFSANSAGDGGGIYNHGTLTVTGSLFTGNGAGNHGGGIYSKGTLTVSNSTFSGNTASFSGGGITGEGTLTVSNSTFSGNTASSSGGGIYGGYDSAVLAVSNSTFSGNSATYGGAIRKVGAIATVRNNLFVRGTSGSNCFGGISGSGNLLDQGSCGAGSINSSTILLGALGNYGGSTQTMPLLPGSAAIDAGDPAFCAAADQRGAARPQGGGCDTGAFESQGFSLGSLTGTPQSAPVNTAFAETLGLAVAANDPAEPVDGGLVTFAPPVDGASAALTGSPATIAGGAVSVSATANGTAGSYDVTASTAGAANVAFSLTNTHPQPTLDTISPASAPAGSGDLGLAVTGSGFVDSSVVRWNGADLATTYLDESQLSAVVPAGSLASVQTAQVTVHTEWGGTSSVLPFFVTEAAAGVVAQQVSSGTDPSAAVAPASAAATGDGLLAVAQYDANPGGTPSFVANGTYFDVYAAPGNSFSQVSIVACGLGANDKLYWWDAALDKWEKAVPQSYDQATGCVTLVVDAGSSPSLSQLQGTVFAVGQQPNTAPVASPGGPYLGAINTAIAMDGSGSSDPDGDPLSYAWDLGDGATAEGVTSSHTYAEAGIYDVCLVVDDGTEPSPAACTLAVVYDPSGGFVTGGGWIDSPAGAYVPDPDLAGRATFGFVSKYKKGQSVPTGTTAFQFQVAGFDFYSETYEWLVVNQAGTNAQFKGSGTVNGGLDPNGTPFKFMIWAGDGSPDTFRIRIWWEVDGTETDVYDNGFDQPIGGGSIVIHKGK